MEIQNLLIFCMELAGTIAFAASGVMTGINCSMDIFGGFGWSNSAVKKRQIKQEEAE